MANCIINTTIDQMATMTVGRWAVLPLNCMDITVWVIAAADYLRAVKQGQSSYQVESVDHQRAVKSAQSRYPVQAADAQRGL